MIWIVRPDGGWDNVMKATVYGQIEGPKPGLGYVSSKLGMIIRPTQREVAYRPIFFWSVNFFPSLN